MAKVKIDAAYDDQRSIDIYLFIVSWRLEHFSWERTWGSCPGQEIFDGYPTTQIKQYINQACTSPLCILHNGIYYCYFIWLLSSLPHVFIRSWHSNSNIHSWYIQFNILPRKFKVKVTAQIKTDGHTWGLSSNQYIFSRDNRGCNITNLIFYHENVWAKPITIK